MKYHKQQAKKIIFVFLVFSLVSSLSAVAFVTGNMVFAKKNGDSSSGGGSSDNGGGGGKNNKGSDGGGSGDNGGNGGGSGDNTGGGTTTTEGTDNNNADTGTTNTQTPPAVENQQQHLQCPTGQHFDVNENGCVQDTPTPPPSQQQQQLQGLVDPNGAPSGALEENNPGLTCVGETHFDNGKCVGNDHLVIGPDGPGSYSCVKGWHLEPGPTCRKDEPTKPPTPTDSTSGGTPGENPGFDPNRHMDTQQTLCIEGTHLDSKSKICVPDNSQKCDPGYHHDVNGQCIIDNKLLDNGDCVEDYHPSLLGSGSFCISNEILDLNGKCQPGWTPAASDKVPGQIICTKDKPFTPTPAQLPSTPTPTPTQLPPVPTQTPSPSTPTQAPPPTSTTTTTNVINRGGSSGGGGSGGITAAPATAQPASSFLTYVNAINKITIRYPSTWTKTELVGNPSIPVIFNAPTTTATTLNTAKTSFVISITPGAANLDSFIQQQINSLTQSNALKYTITDANAKVLTPPTGITAFREISYDGIKNNIPLKGAAIFFVNGGTGYSLLYLAKQTEYTQNLPMIQQMVNSFQIGNGAASTGSGPVQNVAGSSTR